MKKHCNKCQTTKAASEFHKRSASKDGLAARCKDCQQAYDRMRAHLPHRIAARNLKLNGIVGLYCSIPSSHPAATNIDTKKSYFIRNAGKLKEANKAYKKNNPEKRKAHSAVSNSIRSGKIKRGKCMFCDSMYTEGHHPDYSKPLEVIWLCSKHHKLIHQYEKRANDIRGSKIPVLGKIA